MSEMGFLAMAFAVFNVLAVVLGLGAAFLPANSPAGEFLREPVTTIAIVIIIAIIFAGHFVAARSGVGDSRLDTLVANFFTAILTTIFGPLYVAAIGTAVARWLRSGLAARTVFCVIAVLGAVALAGASWYATKR